MDGQLSVPAIHQRQQLHPPGATEIQYRLQRRTHRSTGEQHVIHENDLAAVDGEGNLSVLDQGLELKTGPVVAVEIDVELAEGQVPPQQTVELGLESGRQVHASALNADQGQRGTVAVAFEHLVRQPIQRPGHLLGGHERARFLHVPTPGKKNQELKVTLIHVN